MSMAILACRPVELNDIERQIEAETGQSLTVPYPDSVQNTCEACERAIWIGPRQQQMIQTNPTGCLIACMTCAVALMHEAQGSGAKTSVSHLGNPNNP